MDTYKYIIGERVSKQKIQHIYEFPNGYGASVIGWKYSNEKNEYEIGVIRFFDDNNYYLVYNTPVTEDVIIGVPFGDLDKYLEKIYTLPPVKRG